MSLEIAGEQIYSFLGTPFEFEHSRGRLAVLEDSGRAEFVRHLRVIAVRPSTAELIYNAERSGRYKYFTPSEDIFELGDAIPTSSVVDLIARLPNLRELELELPVTIPTQEQLERIRINLSSLTTLRLVSGHWDRRHTFLRALVQLTPNLETLDLCMIDHPRYKEVQNPHSPIDRTRLPKLSHLILRSPYYLSISRYALFSLDLIAQISKLSIAFDEATINIDAFSESPKEDVSLHNTMSLFGSSLQHLTVTYPLWAIEDALEKNGVQLLDFYSRSLAPLTSLKTLTLGVLFGQTTLLLKLPPSCTSITVETDFAIERENLIWFFEDHRHAIGNSLRGRTLRVKSSDSKAINFVPSWRACQQMGLNVEFTPLAKTSK